MPNSLLTGDNMTAIIVCLLQGQKWDQYIKKLSVPAAIPPTTVSLVPEGGIRETALIVIDTVVSSEISEKFSTPDQSPTRCYEELETCK